MRPIRAAAHAASTPAWPAPTTITSKSGEDFDFVLPTTFLCRTSRRSRGPPHPAARRPVTSSSCARAVWTSARTNSSGTPELARLARSRQCAPRLGEQRGVSCVGDRRARRDPLVPLASPGRSPRGACRFPRQWLPTPSTTGSPTVARTPRVRQIALVRDEHARRRCGLVEQAVVVSRQRHRPRRGRRA